jgi:hypothetical protein
LVIELLHTVRRRLVWLLELLVRLVTVLLLLLLLVLELMLLLVLLVLLLSLLLALAAVCLPWRHPVGRPSDVPNLSDQAGRQREKSLRHGWRMRRGFSQIKYSGRLR